VVGCAGGVEVVGSFFEFLAEVEHLLFQLADAGPECPGFVGASDAAGLEDLFAEYVGSRRLPGQHLLWLVPESLAGADSLMRLRDRVMCHGSCGLSRQPSCVIAIT